MKTTALEAWTPTTRGLLDAAREFAPMARKLPFGANDLEGSHPIATPELAQMRAVVCVHAPRHQDLPYPRWSILAPVIVRSGAVLSVEGKEGVIARVVNPGEIIILDAHSPHSLSAPYDWPDDETLARMDEQEKDALKRKNMSVFFNYDVDVRPTREAAERVFAQRLHVDIPQPAKKRAFR